MIAEQWFSIPIFYEDIIDLELDIIQKEIFSAIPYITQQKISNPSAWKDGVQTTFTPSINDIVNFKLDNLKNKIINESTHILNHYNIPNDDLNINQSWINFYKKGAFQFEHNHVSASYTPRLSGVYYYKTNGEDGDIMFKSNRYQVPSPFVITDISYKPKIGRLLLFPSWLTHRVNINNTENERISIAFNTN